ncbi:MAG: radical SAM protein [Desulfobulbaceae bacterium]|nr:radical SAM protein [Desulfobulbaceae bacterium]
MKKRNVSLSRLNDDIFVVKIFNDYLIYNPLRRVSALVKQEVIGSLKSGGSRLVLHNDQLDPFLCEMEVVPPQPPLGALDPDFLGILPTRDCNLKCVYCGFHDNVDQKEIMDLSLAVEAVDWMAALCADKNKEKLEVHFFGGEPFVAKEVVETVVHRTRQQAAKYGLRPLIQTSTNGYFDEHWCNFVGEYFDAVVISLDGFEDIQNRYRPLKSGQGSFATIIKNIQILSDLQVKICIRICTTEETVGDLVDICTWICTTLRPSIINFESLKNTEESECFGLTPPDPFAYAKACVEAMKIAKKHGVVSVYAAASLENVQHSFCPVGKDVVIVSPNGRISGCYLIDNEWRERGMDMDFGRIDDRRGVRVDEAAVQRVRSYTETKPHCGCCIARYHCAGGCHVTQSYPGCKEEFTDFCVQTRLITICNLLIQLGLEDRVEVLLADRAIMEEVAFQQSDLLREFL